ncbi:MAG TPA: UDP-glucose/GDP-mannose dehydrogenase family protein [Burkholderiaceae bacterium]|nr:UDP-glucose/GDP-mannose dehydrogenase family protein [Burkholderiaceae bacterium]
MKICVFGAGYVGLVTGACLAEMGNSVVCVDVDRQRVEALQRGVIPIHEPGLDALVVRNMAAERLHFTTDTAAAIAHGTLLFIAVGTPPAEDGSADVAAVLTAASAIGRHMRDYKVVIDKSTVPVGTADRVRAVIAEHLARRETVLPFAVVSNPEFLKEGSAVDDFMRPDRVIIGCESEQATLLLRALYAPFLRNRDRLLLMDVRSAELTKYAANAMLATRISFMNELAALAERVGADIEQVRRGIGSDPRIGTHFLYAGCGWGGSCFPKDLRALARTGRDFGIDLSILDAVTRVNDAQRRVLGERVAARFGADLSGHRFALWGLAFKPGTDDMREAPSVAIIESLLRRGARVRAFDPVAMPHATQLFGARDDVVMARDPLEAVAHASALLVVTEWREFRSPDFAAVREQMRTPVIFDGRNLYEPAEMANLGFEYFGIGRRVARPLEFAEDVPLAALAA